MQIILRMTNLPVGSNVGPNFNVVPDVGVSNPLTVTLSQLLAGVAVIVDDAVTSISVESTGLCANDEDVDVPPCVDPLKQLFVDYFNSTQNPTPAGFGQYINSPDTVYIENYCEFCKDNCDRYIIASIETFLKYGEAVGDDTSCCRKIVASIETYLKYAEAVGTTPTTP